MLTNTDEVDCATAWVGFAGMASGEANALNEIPLERCRDLRWRPHPTAQAQRGYFTVSSWQKKLSYANDPLLFGHFRQVALRSVMGQSSVRSILARVTYDVLLS